MIPRKIVIISLCVFVIASVLASSGISYYQECQVNPPPDVEQVAIQMIAAGDIKIAYKEVGTGGTIDFSSDIGITLFPHHTSKKRKRILEKPNSPYLKTIPDPQL